MFNSSLRKVAIIQARMGSSRLRGKILKPLAGRPALERMVERVRRASCVDDIVVATTRNEPDDAVQVWAEQVGIKIFRGSEDDVLERVVGAARFASADLIIQLTGDCPLIDPEIIDELMRLYAAGSYDYVSNVLKRSYPRGLDTQIFSTAVLEEVDRQTTDPHDREHVSIYIYEHPEVFRLGGIEAPRDLFAPDIRICVDTEEDYMLVSEIYNELYPANPRFTSRDMMQLFHRRPELLTINRHVQQKTARGSGGKGA